MKLFLLLAFCVIFNCVTLNYALEVPEYLKAQAKKLHERCKADTGITDDHIKNSGDEITDRNVQCYLYCLFNKVGLIDENNTVHLEHLLDVLPSSMHATIQKLIDNCGTKHGADGCETAYLTVKCYFELEPALRNRLNLLSDY